MKISSKLKILFYLSAVSLICITVMASSGCIWPQAISSVTIKPIASNSATNSSAPNSALVSTLKKSGSASSTEFPSFPEPSSATESSSNHAPRPSFEKDPQPGGSDPLTPIDRLDKSRIQYSNEDLLSIAVNKGETSHKSILDFLQLPPSKGHNSEVLALSFLSVGGDSSPGSILSIDKEGLILFWDLKTGDSFKAGQMEKGVSLATFCSKKLLVAGVDDRKLKVLDLVKNGEMVAEYLFQSSVASLAFDDSCTTLVVGGRDGIVYRLYINGSRVGVENKALERYFGSSNVVSAVASHPDGKFILSGDWNGKLSAWLTYDRAALHPEYAESVVEGESHVATPKRTVAQRPDDTPVDQILLAQNGQALFLTLTSGVLELWDLRGLKLRSSVQGHRGLIYGATVSPKGDKIATIGRDGELKVFQINSRREPGEERVSFQFKEVYSKPFNDLRKLIFIAENRLIASDLKGRLIEILVEAKDLG